ncbi:inositol 1,4,5-triphosphate receptor associated 2 [Homo sapiens]|uniref:Inositol 1,4,5-triphosphate receptor associated 2 n=1 Tax=Homo sapiens TaxID=9606 RepID=G3V3C2_HUMAN|nr:inositol 1,4,5-triphosphate receptor associated 2 [Homo sapiens]KAI4065097.1 inositol 1,4,5-triphosphate receptor associated 2 [Homo sapiens]
MNDDPSMEENGVERVCPESLLQSREYSSLPLPRHTSSTDGTITSSETRSVRKRRIQDQLLPR